VSLSVKGAIKQVFDTKQVSERFSKREFVLELADNPKYPQLVLFQLTGDRCAQLDTVSIGDEVTVEFSLRGREWRSPQGEIRYFNSLDVWDIRTDVVRNAPPPSSRAVTAAASPNGGDAQDDIPFTTCDMAHEPSPIAKVLR
jgi:hypothetical protein